MKGTETRCSFPMAYMCTVPRWVFRSRCAIPYSHCANKAKDPLLFPVSCSAVFVFINYSGYVACSKKHVFHELGIYMARCRDTAELQNYNIQLSIQPLHCKKRFVIWTIVFLTRIATVDMVLWDDTRIVPCDSQLWEIQCTQSSYRNLQLNATRAGSLLRLKISAICSKGHCSLTMILVM